MTLHNYSNVVRVDIDKLYLAKSLDEDHSIEVKKKNFIVLLLGYGYPEYALDLRAKAKDVLRNRGFEVHIMRDIETLPDEKLNDKFRRILRDYSPKLFLILISQNLGASGVSYEVSLLVERYGQKEASKMIRMCVGKRVDMKVSLIQYVTELDEIVIKEYDDNDFNDMIRVMEDTIIDAINLNT